MLGYLEQRAAGVDISDRSIKYCDLAPQGKNFKLTRFGEIILPAGVIEQGVVRDKTALIAVLSQLKKERGVANIIASLPEERAYVVRMSLPKMPLLNLRQAVELQLDEYVPLPAEQLVFDYEVLPTDKTSGKLEVIVSAFPKAEMLDYLEALTKAGLTPVSLEIEAQAMARSLLARADSRTILVVDFGKTRTGFFVAARDQILATSTVSTIGGELITNAIKKDLGLAYNQAEKLKMSQGILYSADPRLRYALMPIISVLRDEINKIIDYGNTHHGDYQQKQIEALIICGGQATLPGLVDYLDSSFDLPIELGNVWANVYGELKSVPPINRNDSLKYATAIGLALKNFSDD